jgi:hypothetical protein
MYVKISDLEIGDVFIEDTFPEMYTVVQIIGGTRHNKPNYLTVIGENNETGESVEFAGKPPYGPTLVLVHKA